MWAPWLSTTPSRGQSLTRWRCLLVGSLQTAATLNMQLSYGLHLITLQSGTQTGRPLG